MDKRSRMLKWEATWAKPAGIAALFGVIALAVAGIAAGKLTGNGDAEVLRAVHAHGSAETLAALLQALGFALWAVPLFYLFRAVSGRDSRVRGQLIGLVVIAPLFLAISSGLSISAKTDAANQFVAGQAKSTLSPAEAHEKCATAQEEEGAKKFGEEYEAKGGATPLSACESKKTEDNEASNAIKEASLAGAVSGFGIAGGLGIAIAFFYTCLWTMRTGLLGRFWASLGMALGVTILIGFILFPMLWFIYVGILIAGWLPRGRPPAWAAGRAIPWPTAGEKAAASLEGEDPAAAAEPDLTAEQSALPPAKGSNGEDSETGPGGLRRKRKKRD